VWKSQKLPNRTKTLTTSILLFILLILPISGSVAQSVPVPPTTAPRSEASGSRYIRSPRLGIAQISTAQLDATDSRYRNALLLGAGWTRWPLYWNAVETSASSFNWGEYDQLVRDDVRHRLSINAILLDRPAFYAEEDRIAGMNEPIFADGSDTPGAGKEINPNNPWAVFVYQAVQRYKPGGTLAQQMGWTNGEGVDVWEVWNEPDLPQFWTAGINSYARLLKIAYIAAHQADPNATVMFGGLLYNTPDNWLARVLAIYVNDPLGASNNYFMDAVAVHSYSYPWRTGWLTRFAAQTLIAYDIDRPIFVNETGISVWDDYPGPTWSSGPEQRYKLGTAEQAAWYFIQSTAYGWAEGAEVVFFHQLYDDCGDQGPGIDFPPNNGELCNNGLPCFGDAFGLFRNPSSAICYSQHPNAGTPRPAATAFRLMAQIFGDEPLGDAEILREEDYMQIIFERPASNELIHVIWNRTFDSFIAQIPALSSNAVLYRLNGTTNLAAVADVYQFELDAALPDNYPTEELEPGDLSGIGGEPVILVESVDGSIITGDVTPVITPGASSGTAAPVTPAIPLRPTVDPATDTISPTTFVDPLPEISSRVFAVSWGAQDNGEIEQYMVWVQINDGEWSPWLETQRSEAIFTGEEGNIYRFAVWAVDTAGNWSSNTDLQPQAETRVE